MKLRNSHLEVDSSLMLPNAALVLRNYYFLEVFVSNSLMTFNELESDVFFHRCLIIYSSYSLLFSKALRKELCFVCAKSLT